MDKREQLKEMRKQHMRDRAEVRDNEMYTREGEDMRIEKIRASMAGVLADPNLSPEARKEKLAVLKDNIDEILDERDERERAFIEQELRHHQLEQELEQEIAADEKPEAPNVFFRPRPLLNVSTEQLRKNIEENRKELSEVEQFSTILINSSERENIPGFTKSRRKKREEPEQTTRIDTVLIKQREIGALYRESAELQELQLKKPAKNQNPGDSTPGPPQGESPSAP